MWKQSWDGSLGLKDDIIVKGEDAFLADPDLAVQFCEGLDLAVFAPAIGTAHGVYQGEPRIAFDRIEEIYHRTQILARAAWWNGLE